MLLSRQVNPTIQGSPSRGADCTADGMTLAGIPLLQRTLAGFAPRPADEIGKLLTGAYGVEFSPTKIQPRLTTIAKALNQGEVARAMVATAQMALPELNAVAASRLAKVHEALVKYDPSEPRDARGRWTIADTSGSGGSDDSNAGTGGVHLIPASDHEPANDNISEALMEQFREMANDPRIINHIFTIACIENIRGGDYYNKTQDCKAANEKCEYLVKLGEEDWRQVATCNYPDGAIVIAKGGALIPVRFGHNW